MSVYSLFQSSVLGLMSQSHALEVIGNNVANVRTGGFKRQEVGFATVLSETVANASRLNVNSDLGGVIPHTLGRIREQGFLETSDRDLDVAVNGRGLFILNTELDSSGEALYGRDGRFEIGLGPATTATVNGATITVNEGYLVDKNGHYLQGWAPSSTGVFPTDESSLQSLRVDPFAFGTVGAPTTQGTLSLNIPAENATGTVETYILDVFDSAGTRQSLAATFIKSATNQWLFDITGAGGDTVTLSPPADFSASTTAAQETVFDVTNRTMTVRGAGGGSPVAGTFTGLTAGDSVAVSGTASNDGTYTVASVAADGSSVTFAAATPPAANETNASTTSVSATGVLGQSLAFDADGFLSSASAQAYTVSVVHAGGTTSNFSLDVSGLTQFASDFTPFFYNHDGMPASELASVRFDEMGNVVGVFASGFEQTLYRLALATFPNDDGLAYRNGNVFAVSEESGAADVKPAGTDGAGVFLPYTHELSNVDLAKEFSDMIITQNAYNSAATVFRTVDEMTQVARDLKRA